MKFGKEIHIQGIRIHVKPLTVKFITTGVSRVCEFMFEFGSFGSKLCAVTGVRSHFEHRGGFLLAFPDWDFSSVHVVVYLWLSAVAVDSGYC